MNRKKIYEEVEEVIVSYCQDCFLQKQFRRDKGRSYAHKFCISQCTVGEKLRELGNKLVDDSQV